MTPVTDPSILAQLNGPAPVTDPALLAQLEAAPQPGYVANFKQMATEGAGQLARGTAQLHNAWDFASSGAGRNVVPDTPANRVAGGFSALDPSGPQAPLTTAEHRGANRQAIGDTVRGFGNVVSGAMGAAYSPVNAALRTYVGQPVAQATGSPTAGTAAEIATGLFGPSVLGRVAGFAGRKIASKPTGEQIEAAGSAGFESPVVRSLEIRPTAPQTWSQAERARMTQAGHDDIHADKTFRTLARLDNIPAGGVVTGQNLQSIRRSLQNTAQEVGANFRPTPDAAAATQAIRSLDNFVENGIAARDVIRGNPAEAAAVWREARGNWAQASKIRSSDQRQIQGEAGAGSAHSGLNFDNTMRQKLRNVATGPEGRWFNQPGERGAVERVVYGSPERNTLRVGSAALGGGGGMGSVVAAGAGGLATGGWGATAPIAGMGLRLLQNSMTRRDMDRLNEILRANSPLAAQQGGAARQGMAQALMSAQAPTWLRSAIAAQLLARTPPLPSE